MSGHLRMPSWSAKIVLEYVLTQGLGVADSVPGAPSKFNKVVFLLEKSVNRSAKTTKSLQPAGVTTYVYSTEVCITLVFPGSRTAFFGQKCMEYLVINGQVLTSGLCSKRVLISGGIKFVENSLLSSGNVDACCRIFPITRQLIS